MGAVHGDSKKRRSLANIYAIYSILYFYKDDFYNDTNKNLMYFKDEQLNLELTTGNRRGRP